MSIVRQASIVFIFMVAVFSFIGGGVYLLNIKMKIEMDAFILGVTTFAFIAIAAVVLILRRYA